MNNWSDQWYDSWRGLVSNQPWQSVLEEWWQGLPGQHGTDPAVSVFEKIAAQSHSFFKLAEELSKAGSAAGTDGNTSDPWQSLEKTLEKLGQGFADPAGSAARNQFWQMPLANWQQAMSNMGGSAAQMFSNPAGDPYSGLNAGLSSLLTTPGLGYTREAQADVQKLSRLGLAYRDAQQRYTDFFLKMNAESLELVRQRLAERAENDDQPIDSVRQLYDLWVECSEEVYARHALTDEYATLNGQLVNALMALKQHSTQLSDNLAGMLNLPTRREIDTLHHRFHAERRAGKEKEQKLAAVQRSNETLLEQVQKLENRLGDLENKKAKSSGKSAGARTRAGAAGRKTATRSKKASPNPAPGE